MTGKHWRAHSCERSHLSAGVLHPNPGCASGKRVPSTPLGLVPSQQWVKQGERSESCNIGAPSVALSSDRNIQGKLLGSAGYFPIQNSPENRAGKIPSAKHCQNPGNSPQNGESRHQRPQPPLGIRNTRPVSAGLCQCTAGALFSCAGAPLAWAEPPKPSAASKHLCDVSAPPGQASSHRAEQTRARA